MASLSLCLIVKNEEDVLERCLESVKDIVDEIVIVDTGSSDRTKEIASRYTSLLYSFVWVDDFAAARNFSFKHATKDYIIWLDADDVLDDRNRAQLRELKETLPVDVDVVMMKYDVAFDEDGKPTFSYYRERILKRSKKFHWVGEIHEAITPTGNIIYSEIAVAHRKIRPNEPQRNLRIFESLLKQGRELDARQKYYYARELYYNTRFEEAIDVFQAFLSENKGWLENNISACKELAACFEMTQREPEALRALFRSFEYAPPRAEICCELGRHFIERAQYDIAIYWYKQATGMQNDLKNGGFSLPDCYDYTPFMQLCVCYDRLGEYAKANEYNEMAGKIKPNSKNYLANKKYFEQLSISSPREK